MDKGLTEAENFVIFVRLSSAHRAGATEVPVHERTEEDTMGGF